VAVVDKWSLFGGCCYLKFDCVVLESNSILFEYVALFEKKLADVGGNDETFFSATMCSRKVNKT